MRILQGLNSSQFDSLWAGKHDWYEEPNYRRGGWSGVCKMQLDGAEGPVEVYLKQQFRHSYRSFLNLFRKQPTALREYLNIQRLQAYGIPTVDVVLFGVEDDKAILATKALDDYQAVDQLDISGLSIHQRRALIRAVALCIKKLHQHRFQHNCLYPKHIFVRQNADGWSVKLIDLEKMKRRWRADSAMHHDLDTLYRRSLHLFNQHDRLCFLRTYFGSALSPSLLKHL